VIETILSVVGGIVVLYTMVVVFVVAIPFSVALMNIVFSFPKPDTVKKFAEFWIDNVLERVCPFLRHYL